MGRSWLFAIAAVAVSVIGYLCSTVDLAGSNLVITIHDIAAASVMVLGVGLILIGFAYRARPIERHPKRFGVGSTIAWFEAFTGRRGSAMDYGGVKS